MKNFERFLLLCGMFECNFVSGLNTCYASCLNAILCYVWTLLSPFSISMHYLCTRFCFIMFEHFLYNFASCLNAILMFEHFLSRCIMFGCSFMSCLNTFYPCASCLNAILCHVWTLAIFLASCLNAFLCHVWTLSILLHHVWMHSVSCLDTLYSLASCLNAILCHVWILYILLHHVWMHSVSCLNTLYSLASCLNAFCVMFEHFIFSCIMFECNSVSCLNTFYHVVSCLNAILCHFLTLSITLHHVWMQFCVMFEFSISQFHFQSPLHHV